jgi:hypothetical protein
VANITTRSLINTAQPLRRSLARNSRCRPAPRRHRIDTADLVPSILQQHPKSHRRHNKHAYTKACNLPPPLSSLPKSRSATSPYLRHGCASPSYACQVTDIPFVPFDSQETSKMAARVALYQRRHSCRHRSASRSACGVGSADCVYRPSPR